MASLGRPCGRFAVFIRNFPSCSQHRFSSSESLKEGLPNPAIVVTGKKSPILCWHPEKPFPYEHTKPLPRNVSEMQEADSVLKVQYLQSEKNKFRQDGPTQRELMQIFHATKHRFYPWPRSIYRAKRLPPDRESI